MICESQLFKWMEIMLAEELAVPAPSVLVGKWDPRAGS